MNLEPQAEPRIDYAVIEQVRQLGAVRPGLLQRLVEKFRESTEALLAPASTHDLAAQSERLRIGFHTLKGAAASLGAARLSALAWHIERSLSTGIDASQLQVELEAIRLEADETLEELDDFVRTSR